MNQEILFFCPLECGARIKSLSKHLIKCKNYKLLGVTYKRCDYNSSHIIKNEFYELHLISCDSKKKLEELDNNSNDDDLKDKLNDDSIERKINDNKNGFVNKENKENKYIKDEETNRYFKRKKRRYEHEKALFKNESEIDKECLDFFKKVYV